MEVITSIEQCLLQYTRRSVKTKPNICYWNIEQYANNNPQTTVDCFFLHFRTQKTCRVDRVNIDCLLLCTEDYEKEATVLLAGR